MDTKKFSKLIIVLLCASLGTNIWFITNKKSAESTASLHSTDQTKSKVISSVVEKKSNRSVDVADVQEQKNKNKKVVEEFVRTYFDTSKEPYLKKRIDLLQKKELLKPEYLKEIKDSIGDINNEDAKMKVENLDIFTNDNQTFLVSFNLKLGDDAANHDLVYVAKVTLNGKQISNYQLVATNSKMKESDANG